MHVKQFFKPDDNASLIALGFAVSAVVGALLVLLRCACFRLIRRKRDDAATRTASAAAAAKKTQTVPEDTATGDDTGTLEDMVNGSISSSCHNSSVVSGPTDCGGITHDDDAPNPTLHQKQIRNLPQPTLMSLVQLSAISSPHFLPRFEDPMPDLCSVDSSSIQDSLVNQTIVVKNNSIDDQVVVRANSNIDDDVSDYSYGVRRKRNNNKYSPRDALSLCSTTSSLSSNSCGSSRYTRRSSPLKSILPVVRDDDAEDQGDMDSRSKTRDSTVETLDDNNNSYLRETGSGIEMAWNIFPASQPVSSPEHLVVVKGVRE